MCPANWRQSSEEIAFIIDDIEPALVLYQNDLESVTSRANKDEANGRYLDYESDDFMQLLTGDAAPPRPSVSLDDPLILMYTAAFSGRPSAAILSTSAIYCQNLTLMLTDDLTADYCYLNSGPLFHAAALAYTMATLHVGGRNVFLPKSDPPSIAAAIQEHGCNGGFVLPQTMMEIAALNADGSYDLSSFRRLGGGAAWDAMAGQPTSRAGTVPGGYGQTEAFGLLALRCLSNGGPPMSGYASPWLQVSVLDENGGEAPPGQVGEICARGPGLFSGYWNRPDVNAERFEAGRYFTRDLGFIDEDGRVVFLAPKLRLIKSGMENIYPAEVESAIKAHPKVKDAAVIGVPDPVWAQSVKALVVAEPGSAVSADDLIAFCREKIASYKKPREVLFVEAIPRTGFVPDYDALDAAYGGGNYPGSGSSQHGSNPAP